MRSSRAILAAALGVVSIGAAAWWSLRELPSEESNVRRTEERAALRHRADEIPVPAPELEATRSDEPGDRTAESGGHGLHDEGAATRRRARWRPVLLHVLDRRTREPLRDLRVLLVGIPEDEGRDVPDPHLPNAIRGDSPITIGPEIASLVAARFLVSAPDHASATIVLDFESGGERELLLEPACQLRVRLEAPPEPSEAERKILGEKLVLELRRFADALEWLQRQIAGNAAYAAAIGRDASPWLRAREDAALRMRERDPESESSLPALTAASLLAPATWRRRAPLSQVTSFEALAPGEWLIVVVSEERRDRSLGAAVVRLVPGESVERTIVVRSSPVPVHSISGTLLLDPGWNLDAATRQPTKLVIEPSGAIPGSPIGGWEITEFRFAGGGRFAWRADGLPAGIYFAQLEQYGYCAELEVDPESPQEFEIVVPAPCDVELSAVDPQTHSRANVAEILHWTGGGDGIYARVATLDEVDDRFRFRAPLGRLHVRFHRSHDRYFMTEKAFDLAPGLNDLVLELASRAALRIELRDGATRVPWEDPYHVVAHHVGGRGGIVGWSQDARGVEYFLNPAGRYRVSIDGVPGFERSEGIDVDVVAGETVDVAIPLARAR